jgi:cell division cycle protein 20 (cofactor of APC complex)
MKSCPPTPRTADRFIPNRADIDFDYCHHALTQEVDENGKPVAAPGTANSPNRSLGAMLSSVLGGRHRDHPSTDGGSSLLSPGRLNPRLVDCFARPRRPALRLIGDEALLLRPANWTNGSALSAVGLTGTHPPTSSPAAGRNHRAIPSAPSRVLDAPDLMDDYYLNLLSWGINNVIAVALNQVPFLCHSTANTL